MSASAPFLLPIDTAPMEAKRADAIPVEQGVWQYEPKWDGFRCLSFKAGNAVDIRAKSGKPLARYFPELVDHLCNLPAAQFVIDGEILIERTGNYSFDALQMRLHPAESRIRKLAVETPAKLMVFDMLADPTGQVLTDRPLSRRRAALERLVRRWTSWGWFVDDRSGGDLGFVRATSFDGYRLVARLSMDGEVSLGVSSPSFPFENCERPGQTYAPGVILQS